MFKKTLAIGAVALFTLTSTVFAASAASDVAPGNPPRWAPGSASGAPRYNAQIDPAPAVGDLTPLTEEEISALQFMREEEKLAHDVYITLYEKWDLRLHEYIWGTDLAQMSREFGEEMGLLVFGRVTYEGMAAYWPNAGVDNEDPAQGEGAGQLARRDGARGQALVRRAVSQAIRRGGQLAVCSLGCHYFWSLRCTRK